MVDTSSFILHLFFCSYFGARRALPAEAFAEAGRGRLEGIRAGLSVDTSSFNLHLFFCSYFGARRALPAEAFAKAGRVRLLGNRAGFLVDTSSFILHLFVCFYFGERVVASVEGAPFEFIIFSAIRLVSLVILL